MNIQSAREIRLNNQVLRNVRAFRLVVEVRDFEVHV